MFEYYIERIYNLNSLLLLGSSVGLRKLCRNLSNCSLNMRKPFMRFFKYLKSASNLNGNLNCSKELEHYAS